MTDSVIQLLEVIQIYIKYGGRMLMTFDRPQSLLEMFLEQAVVLQSGQGVVE